MLGMAEYPDEIIIISWIVGMRDTIMVPIAMRTMKHGLRLIGVDNEAKGYER